MASEADHIALANRNHDALLHLVEDVERFPEWVTTIAFYKAVQIVEATFCHKIGKHSEDHPRRMRQLKLTPFKPLYRHFRVLWSESTIARYLQDNESSQGYSTYTDHMPAEEVAQKIVLDRLLPLEQTAMSLLSPSGKARLTQIHRETVLDLASNDS